jgi:hypothetical protein
MCCIPLKSVASLLDVLDFEIVDVVAGTHLILHKGYDKCIVQVAKTRLDFATRYLNSLESGDRHCYFGNVQYKNVTIRLVWGSCSQYDEIDVEGIKPTKFWINMCIFKTDDDHDLVTRWLSDMVAYFIDHGHPRIAVYNQNGTTIESDSIKLQAYVKTWRLYCLDDCLDPFCPLMKNIINSSLERFSSLCGDDVVACNCTRGIECNMFQSVQENILKTLDIDLLNNLMTCYVEKMKSIKYRSGLVF